MTAHSKHLTILQVSTADLGGGAKSSAWNLFRVFRELGHSSHLVVGRKYSDDPNVLEIPAVRRSPLAVRLLWTVHGRLEPLQGRLPGIPHLRHLLHAAAAGRTEFDRALGREPFHFPGSRRLMQLAPQRPHIVHAHNLHGDYFDLRHLPKLSREVPLVLNLRDMWLLTGHCAYSVDCGRWRTGCGQCPDLDIYPPIGRDATAANWRRKRSIYARSRLYVSAPSEWLMGRARESMLTGAQHRVIPNAVDLDIFRPMDRIEARRRLGLPVGSTIILLTAQTPFKDHDLMLSALGQLQADSGQDLLFICLGKRGEGRRLGTGRIVYPGWVARPREMAAYYASADIFIHAAKAEAFGKTLVESMAVGVAPIATAVGGIPEVVNDARTGRLVPPGDFQAMAEAISSLLGNPSLRESMGRAGVEEARLRFGLRQQADAFLSWYREVIEDWRSARARRD